MRLGKSYGAERLEAACQRARTLGACSYKRIESILKNGLERRPLPQKPDTTAGPAPPNIRGPHYYEEDRGAPSCSRILPATNCRP